MPANKQTIAGITRKEYAVVVRGQSPDNTRRARSYKIRPNN